MIEPAHVHPMAPIVGAGVSVSTGVMSYAPILAPWIQLLAGMTAVLSGLASLAWYIYNLKRALAAEHRDSAVASAIVLATAQSAADVVNKDAKAAADVVVAAAETASIIAARRYAPRREM